MTDPQQMRTYFSPDEATRIQRYAEDHQITYAQAVRQLVAKGLGEEALTQGALWLESLSDAILAKYFQTIPTTLDHLVESTFAMQSWQRSTMAKLLEIGGEKDPANRAARVAALAQKVDAYAMEKHAEFYRTIGGDQTLTDSDENEI